MTHHTRMIAALGILMLVLGIWLLGRPVQHADAAPEIRPATVDPVQPPAAAEAEPPVFGTPEFASRAKERGAAWLAARGRDAGSLVAMWDVTGDETLLREAAEKYPDSPVVSVAMAQMLMDHNPPGPEARKWVDQFIKNTPGNPMGYFFLAALTSKEGDPAGTVAALEGALTQTGRPDALLRDRSLTVKEGASASGESVLNAAWIGIAAPSSRASSQIVLGGIGKAFRTSFAELEAAGDTEGIQNLAELALKSSEQLRYSSGASLIEQLIRSSIHKMALTKMDPSTEIGDTGSTAGQLAAEESDMKELIDRNTELSEYFEAASDPVRIEHYNRVILDGEVAAMRELLARKDREQSGK